MIIFHMATILGGFGLNVQFSKKTKSGFELGLSFGLVETYELNEHKLQLEVSLGTRTERWPVRGLGLLGDTG